MKEKGGYSWLRWVLRGQNMNKSAVDMTSLFAEGTRKVVILGDSLSMVSDCVLEQGMENVCLLMVGNIYMNVSGCLRVYIPLNGLYGSRCPEVVFFTVNLRLSQKESCFRGLCSLPGT